MPCFLCLLANLDSQTSSSVTYSCTQSPVHSSINETGTKKLGMGRIKSVLYFQILLEGDRSVNKIITNQCDSRWSRKLCMESIESSGGGLRKEDKKLEMEGEAICLKGGVQRLDLAYRDRSKHVTPRDCMAGRRGGGGESGKVRLSALQTGSRGRLVNRAMV